MLRNNKKLSLMEMLITIPLIMILVFIASNFILLLYQTKDKTTSDLQRININTVLNLNHWSLVCYYSSIGAEEVGIDGQGNRAFNEDEVWLLNNGNGEGENELCEVLKANLKKQYGINPTGDDEVRLLKHFFIIRTQTINVYTYKLVLWFAVDEEKWDVEHIQRWNDRAKGWYDYWNYLLQIYSIDYIGNILKIGSNFNASAGNAVNELLQRVRTSGDLEQANYEIYADIGEKVENRYFGYRFNKLNFNLIDDAKIDKFDHWFPYNQMMIQASYKNWDHTYRDYYAYKNWQ